MPDLEDLLDERLAATGMPTRAEPGQRASVAIRRYVVGITNGNQLREELRRLGYSGIRMERLAISAHLDRERAIVQAQVDVVVQDYRRGRLTAELLGALLRKVGLSPEVADLRVAEEVGRLAEPTARRTSVGLVILPAAEGLVLDRPVRRTAVGLQIVTAVGTGVRDTGQRPTAVGLQIIAAELEEEIAVVRRRTALGLQLITRPETGLRELGQRPTQLGLVIIIRK